MDSGGVVPAARFESPSKWHSEFFGRCAFLFVQHFRTRPHQCYPSMSRNPVCRCSFLSARVSSRSNSLIIEPEKEGLLRTKIKRVGSFLRNVTPQFRIDTPINNYRITIGVSEVIGGRIAPVGKDKSDPKVVPVRIHGVIWIERAKHYVRRIISLSQRLFSYRICSLSLTYLLMTK